MTLLSYEHMDKGRVMNEEDIMGVFEKFARVVEREGSIEEEAEQWLSRMREDHLLVSAGFGEFVFIHSTMMEYLAARYIVEKWQDPFYMEEFFKNKDYEAHLAKKGSTFFLTEILPIAVGSGIKNGAKILKFIKELINKKLLQGVQGDGFLEKSPPGRRRQESQRLYNLALKCLVEFESFIDRQYRRKRLEMLHRDMEAEIEAHWEAVDWVYRYLKDEVLTTDKDRLKVLRESFENISRFSRPTFLTRYLDHERFFAGDSEIVGMREELLFKIMKKDIVEQWLAEHRLEEEKEFEKEEKLLTLDSAGYHPEDKNFNYYAQYTGEALTGFLGSPNLKHSGVVTCAAVSPDGKWLLSGSSDNNLKLWDLQSGKEVRTFKGHSSGVTSVCFAPGGKNFLSGSYDHTLKLWDLQSGKEVRTFEGHQGSVTSVCFAPGGKNILSGSSDHTLKLWELQSGKEVHTFEGHSNWVRSVCFAPGGKNILSGSDDHTLKLWELQSGKKVRTFKGHQGSVYSVCFAPGGKNILSGSDDNTLKLWDPESGKEVHTFKGHSDWVNSICFAPGEKNILSGSNDHTLKLWDLQSGKEVRTFKGHSDWVTSVCFAPGGKNILSGSDDHTLKLWDPESGKEVRTFKGHSRGVTSVCFAPGGKNILSGSSDHTLKLWDLQSGKEVRTFKGHQDTVTSVCFAPGGETSSPAHMITP